MISIDAQKILGTLVEFGRLSNTPEEPIKTKRPLLQLVSNRGRGHFFRLIQLGQYRFTPHCWVSGLDLKYIRTIAQTALNIFALDGDLSAKFSTRDISIAVTIFNRKIEAYNEKHPEGLPIPSLNFTVEAPDGAVRTVESFVPRRGIRNSGNSCYLDALFVAMCRSHGFRQELMRCKRPNEINKGMRNLFFALTRGKGRAVSPSSPPLSHILSALGRRYSSLKSVSELFRGKRIPSLFSQQDVQEASLFMLEAVLERSDLIQFREIVEKKALLGCFVPSVDCKSLEYEEPKIESSNMLPVSLRGKKSFSLQQNFTGVDDLEEVELDHILHREENRDLDELHTQELLRFEGGLPVVRRHVLCGTPPPVLLIHLHRFRVLSIRDDKEKVIAAHQYKRFTRVEIPFHLNVPFLSGEMVTYILRSVVVHSGSGVGGGHYMTYIPYQSSERADKLPSRWIEYNDDTLSVHTWEQVQKIIEKQGYILVYDICDDPKHNDEVT